MSYASKEQLEELASYMASQINVPTIGIGGGYAPIGTIISYMGTTAPQDYLACDGSTKNIADYPQLADFFEAQFGSKNYFGGDGTTTFAVPDLRGEFLRGTGTNSHTNQGSGANVGVHQDGSRHTAIGAQSNVLWASQGNMWSEENSIPDSKQVGVALRGNTQFNNTSASNGFTYTSRPTNTSVLYCIKAVNAGDVYSTDERVVGTWIDGKPIYRRVLSGDSLPAHGTVFLTDVDSVVNAYGKQFFTSGPCWYQFPYVSYNGTKNIEIRWEHYNTDNTVRFRSNNVTTSTTKYVYIFEYTKTTD